MWTGGSCAVAEMYHRREDSQSIWGKSGPELYSSPQAEMRYNRRQANKSNSQRNLKQRRC